MKKSIYAILALSVLFASCDSWVENAETPSNTLTRDQLNKSAMVANIQSNSITDGPLVAYVKTLQGDASAAAFLALGTTVDELTEGTIPNALLLLVLQSQSVRCFVHNNCGFYSKDRFVCPK